MNCNHTIYMYSDRVDLFKSRSLHIPMLKTLCGKDLVRDLSLN